MCGFFLQILKILNINTYQSLLKIFNFFVKNEYLTP
jgi:hypothetical protein